MRKKLAQFFAVITASLLVSTTGVFMASAQTEQADAPTADFLSVNARQQAGSLIVQDYQGRMKPLDTLCREMVMKVTKRGKFEGWHPVDLYLSWLANPEYWWERPLLAVRFAGMKDILGIDAGTSHVSATSLFDEAEKYRLHDAVEQAMRTADAERTKLQRRLLSFDERFNLFYMTLRGGTFRAFPVPGDPNHTWLDIREVQEKLANAQGEQYREAFMTLLDGLKGRDDQTILSGIHATAAIQKQYGAEVIPSDDALQSELFLNRMSPFGRITLPYLVAFLLLMVAFFWGLVRRKGAPYSLRHPLYALGSLVFWVALLAHVAGYTLRWIASGRAPLSNGYESLLFISLAVGIAGLIFELKDRRGAAGGLAALLTAVVLGVAMMATFDPAIGPLVPVLASYWLIIHVTVITASYGFLGQAALLGALVLILHLFKGEGRETVRQAILKLDHLNFYVILTGLGLLTIGTLLGGVWANESWGRYWGWDAKETWSLVTILIYAMIIHFRWIPGLRSPWILAASSFAAISSVVMTYFGVNYFLTGLHSYAQGDVARVPTWVYIFAGCMLTLIVVSRLVDLSRNWAEKSESD